MNLNFLRYYKEKHKVIFSRKNEFLQILCVPSNKDTTDLFLVMHVIKIDVPQPVQRKRIRLLGSSISGWLKEKLNTEIIENELSNYVNALESSKAFFKATLPRMPSFKLTWIWVKDHKEAILTVGSIISIIKTILLILSLLKII